jgi:hypothetical protein
MLGPSLPVFASSPSGSPDGKLSLQSTVLGFWDVSVAKGLERRLEKLLEGVAGRVFSGRLHPSELAGKLAREADFARFERETGPATANAFTILVNPRDFSLDPGELEHTLADEMTQYTAEEGLRLEGPVTVTIEASDKVGPGNVVCHVEVIPGSPQIWARLAADSETLEVGRNRVLVGRAPVCDLVVSSQDVSRKHALIWRQAAAAFIQDLDSSNGTFVDGTRVHDEPVELHSGSVIGLGDRRYRFVKI